MKALAALLVLTGIANADPDPLAKGKAEEANLESDAPRQGITFSAAFAGGMLISKGTVGEMPTASLRLGHVATPSTVVTLELTAGSFFHQLGGTRLTDTTSSVLVGGQFYTAPTFWLRAAGGANVHTIDNGPMGTSVATGPAGLFGGGVDLVVHKFWRIGIEAWGLAAVNRDGLLWTGALGVGISHY